MKSLQLEMEETMSITANPGSSAFSKLRGWDERPTQKVSEAAATIFQLLIFSNIVLIRPFPYIRSKKLPARPLSGKST
jgi:hypothetical protein